MARIRRSQGKQRPTPADISQHSDFDSTVTNHSEIPADAPETVLDPFELFTNHHHDSEDGIAPSSRSDNDPVGVQQTQQEVDDDSSTREDSDDGEYEDEGTEAEDGDHEENRDEEDASDDSNEEQQNPSDLDNGDFVVLDSDSHVNIERPGVTRGSNGFLEWQDTHGIWRKSFHPFQDNTN